MYGRSCCFVFRQRKLGSVFDACGTGISAPSLSRIIRRPIILRNPVLLACLVPSAYLVPISFPRGAAGILVPVHQTCGQADNHFRSLLASKGNHESATHLSKPSPCRPPSMMVEHRTVSGAISVRFYPRPPDHVCSILFAARVHSTGLWPEMAAETWPFPTHSPTRSTRFYDSQCNDQADR